MRAAIIANGIVASIIEVNSLEDHPGAIDATGASVGGAYTGGIFYAVPVEATAIPDSITNYQCRAVLMAMPSLTAGKSLYDLVDAALQAQSGVALQAWEYANNVMRSGEMVAQMTAALGLTAAQVDAMFVAGSAIGA